MLAKLLLLFIVVPFVELTLLLWLAQLTDWRWTLALVIVTGIIGSLLARSQGFRTWRRIQLDLSQGRMPTESLLDAVLILLAGALLLTPGLLTDAFGLSLLIPLCRGWYRRALVHWFQTRFKVRDFHAPGAPPDNDDPNVIDSVAVDRTRPDDADR